MAQTGYTPILIYSSSTTTNAPAVGNLTNSTLGSELAINITDGKLFYKDNANAIQVIGWKTTPTTAGGTGLTSYTAGDLLYYATGTTLAKLAIGANTTVLTSSGSAPQWTAQSALSVGTAANLLSNATTGVMQITGPGTGTTRVMTIPNANFTAARTDTSQTFNDIQTFLATASSNNDARWVEVVSDNTAVAANNGGGILFRGKYTGTTLVDAASVQAYKENATDGEFGYGLRLVTRANGGNLTAGLEQRPNGDIASRVGNFVVGTSGKGIDFSATAGTGTSELLADYEEGTWTAVLRGATTAGTYEFVNNTCQYTKVGRVVTLTAFLRLAGTITGGGVGYAQITGLPYEKVNNSWAVGAVSFSGVAFSGAPNIAPITSSNTSILYFPELVSGGGTECDISDFGTGDYLSFTITYITA